MNKTSKILAGASAAALAVSVTACAHPAPMQCNPYAIFGQPGYCAVQSHMGGGIMPIPIFISGGGYYYPGYAHTIYHGYPPNYTGPRNVTRVAPPHGATFAKGPDTFAKTWAASHPSSARSVGSNPNGGVTGSYTRAGSAPAYNTSTVSRPVTSSLAVPAAAPVSVPAARGGFTGGFGVGGFSGG